MLVKVIIQRVLEANVKIEGRLHSEVEKGLLLLVGITDSDTKEIIQKMAEKISFLRIFEDDQGKMNRSVQEIEGEILSVSQFTLYGDCRRGRRPNFIQAARPEVAKPLIDFFHQELRRYVSVKEGVFGAEMKVELINDGPVTIILDSTELGCE